MSRILITGANRGIGLALVERLSARGDEVIAVCRHRSDELDRTSVRVEADVDVTDDHATAALAERLQGVHLDQLWLNAGVLERDTLEGIDAVAFDALRRQFEVNALGPLRVVKALQRNLGEGSKVAIITSRMGSVGDNDSGGYYGYRASKAAVNAIGKSLAVDLKPRGIAVFLLHPGYVQTEMGGPGATVPPEQSAEGLVERVDNLNIGQTGTFWHANGSALPW